MSAGRQLFGHPAWVCQQRRPCSRVLSVTQPGGAGLSTITDTTRTNQDYERSDSQALDSCVMPSQSPASTMDAGATQEPPTHRTLGNAR